MNPMAFRVLGDIVSRAKDGLITAAWSFAAVLIIGGMFVFIAMVLTGKL